MCTRPIENYLIETSNYLLYEVEDDAHKLNIYKYPKRKTRKDVLSVHSIKHVLYKCSL